MDFPFHRACAHALRAFTFACAVLLWSGAFAHEGHDHGTEPPAVAGAPTSPRVVATSEAYQFVGIVEGEVLVIYLDRAADNSPVTTAKIELTLDGEPTKVEPNQGDRTYEATSPLLRKPGSHEVLVKLSEGDIERSARRRAGNSGTGKQRGRCRLGPLAHAARCAGETVRIVRNAGSLPGRIPAGHHLAGGGGPSCPAQGALHPGGRWLA